MLSDFTTTLSAKWILAGEHAVVRQHPAIVYPLGHFQFSLVYQCTPDPWQVTVQGIHNTALETLFLSTLEHAVNTSNSQHIDRTGLFIVNNNIPLGSGLGASAAFCLAISQWMAAQGIIDSNQIYQQGKQLENIFHGQSSGLDIIGAGATSGRYFHAGKHITIQQNWQPHWYLSYSGIRCKTNLCIEQVNSLWQEDASTATTIDQQMSQSVQLALSALIKGKDGLTQLADAINLAKNCFEQWGLIDANLKNHISELTNAGALACKPTGSGSGGYVISLWPQPAPKLSWPMIPLQLTSPKPKAELTKEYIHHD